MEESKSLYMMQAVKNPNIFGIRMCDNDASNVCEKNE